MHNHLYRAYGLNITSDIAFPELLPGSPNDAVDLTIRRLAIERPLPAKAQVFEFGETLQKLDWPSIGKFDIRGTDEIVVDPNPDVPEALVRIPLLGSVMAALLHMRGLFVLHASSVLIKGQAVGFLGDKGAGKSTIGGALISHGHSLLTDDVLACDCDGPLTVRPGFPQMKLTPESAGVVSLPNSTTAPRIDFPGFHKQQFEVSSYHAPYSAPLKRLYILERSCEAGVIDISVTEAFQMLMRFSYLIRFGKTALSTPAATALLQQCSTIASQNVVRRLIIPDDLSALPEAIRLIEADIGV